MKRVLLLIALVACFACGREERDANGNAIEFKVYPGSRNLPELTELFKKASAVGNPGHPVPPQFLYDTDASLDDVANFYAKNNGYSKVAPDASGNMSSVAPPAYYRSGDLHADNAGLSGLFDKLNMKVDLTKAVGQYRGAHISASEGHPRVTLSRPYFDPTKSQVVNKTLIIMVQE